MRTPDLLGERDEDGLIPCTKEHELLPIFSYWLKSTYVR